ncbi:GNAT family N-acetyltransferase [Streptomyces scopuliridis]|uniref:GNAT family N-acetyltransferase n=1 Tax=Streptomyces scopuliridis TaxID=452529 RepID=UPI00369EF1A3
MISVGWPNVDEETYRDMAEALREFADDADDDGHAAHQHIQRPLSSGQRESLTALAAHWSKAQGKHKDLAKAARIAAGALDRVADLIVARKMALPVNCRPVRHGRHHARVRPRDGRSVDAPGWGEDRGHPYAGNAVIWSTQQPRLRYVLGVDVDGDLVGVVKLNVTEGVGRLSDILRQNTWGRGYATGAVSGLLALAFGPLSLPAVHAKHQVQNRASGRVLLKAGFTHTDTTHGFSSYVARRTGELTSAGCVRDEAR